VADLRECEVPVVATEAAVLRMEVAVAAQAVRRPHRVLLEAMQS
jgi:hypothetical protein